METKNYNRTYNILLTEDDEDDFYLFNLAIAAIDGSVEVLRTCNGIQLSSLLQCHVKLDAIFLDINLPYKSGIECLRELRKNELYKSTRIIMYTTSSYDKDIDESYNEGANYYLVKPTTSRIGVEQFKKLFSSPYFTQNQQPPRSQFVIPGFTEKMQLS